MLTDLSNIGIGFLLLTVGAEVMVSGAAQLAKKWGIRPLVIGLTIVALGTSAPELAVSISASLSAQGDIAIGNVVGSNISNIGLVLGLATLIRPITVQIRLIRFEIPLLIGISVIIYLIAFMGQIPRWCGFLLLAGLVVYIGVLYRLSLKERPEVEAEFVQKDGRNQSLVLNFIKIFGGFACLAGGGYLLVEGAVGFARWAGISELVIGLTIVAIGTSLPEVVTSLVAVRRNHGDIAIGNVLGSNIFNSLGVLGGAALVHPISVERALVVRDLPVMVVLTFLLFPFLRTGVVLRRWEGTFLLTTYIAYLAMLFLSHH